MNNYSLIRRICAWAGIFALLTLPLSAQIFNRSYGIGNGEFVQENADNSFTMIANFTHTTFAIRTDANGNELWQKGITQPLIRVRPVGMNGFLAVGQRDNRILVRRTDNADNLLWEYHATEENSMAFAFKTLNDGSFLITGRSAVAASIGGSNFEKDAVFLMKLSAGGQRQFFKTYNPGDANDNGVGRLVEQLRNGQIVVVSVGYGYSGSPTALSAYGDIYLFDANMNLLSKKPAGIISNYLNHVVPTDLKVTSDGGFLLTAFAGVFCHRCDGFQPYFTKFRPDGSVWWSYSGNRPTSQFFSAVETPDGGAFGLGISYPEFSFPGDPSGVLRYSNTGVLNCKNLEPPIKNNAYIIRAKNGDYVITSTDATGEVYLYRQNENLCDATQTMDLELAMTGPAVSPVIYSTFYNELKITNKGPVPATNVRVKFVKPTQVVYVGGNEYQASQGSFSPYGNEEWNVGTLAPGATATLKIQFFLLQTANTSYTAEVISADQKDADSYPGNYICCYVPEDDNAYLFVIASNRYPDMLISAMRAPANGLPGSVVNFTIDLTNQGNGTASGDFNIDFYLSTDAVQTIDDVHVGVIPTGNIVPGTIPNIPAAISIPTNFPLGNYYLLGVVDKDLVLTETDRNNNLTAVPFQIGGSTPGADLQWDAAHFLPVVMQLGEPFNIDIQFSNRGTGTAGNFDIGFYISTDAQWDAATDVKLFSYTVFGMAPYPNALGTTSFNLLTIPTNLPPGNYKLLVVLDENNVVPEVNEGNNVHVSDMQVLLNGRPDLVLQSLTGLPATANAGGSFGFEINYANTGAAAVRNAFAFRLYLSTDQQLSTNDAVLAETNFAGQIPIPVHFGFSRTGVQAMIPGSMASGNYFLIGVMDWLNEVYETDENNNFFMSPIHIQATSGVDLELSLTTGNANPRIYSNFTTTARITNKGANTATGVKVRIPRVSGAVYVGGNEYRASQGNFEPYLFDEWTVGSLAAGATATLDLNYFRLSVLPMIYFAQVTAQNETDADSAPNNGGCCVAREDDEAVLNIGASTVNPRELAEETDTPFGKKLDVLSVYPNPVSEELKVVFQSKMESVDYAVYDAHGRQILSGNQAAGNEISELRLDVQALPEGLYFLLFSTSERPEPVRFMKVER